MACEGGFHDRMAPGFHQECVVVGDLGAAPGAGLGELCRGLRGIEERERVGAGCQCVRVCQRGLDQVGEDRPFACGGAFAGFRDAAVEFGEFGRGEACAVGHALAEGQLGEPAQLLDRGGGGLDDVAKLGVVADLQAGDAVALGPVELEGSEDAAAVVAEGAFGVKFAVVAREDRVAIVQAVRRGVGKGSGQGCREGRVEAEGVSGGLERGGKHNRQ
jgi:hypothetical protein